jgi:predicted metalloprotease
MRLDGSDDNTYVDDLRGAAPPGGRGGFGGGGGGFGIPMGRGMGIGGTLLVLVLSLVFGGNFFGGGGGSAAPAPSNYPGGGYPAGDPRLGGAPAAGGSRVAESATERETRRRLVAVLNNAQPTFARLVRQQLGTEYRPTRLVLFREAVQSGCGMAPAEVGPFYCPRDERVFIDLSFYDELASKFGAPGDFAQAYVLAHEIGHHIQKVTGTEARVRQLQDQRPQLKNNLSVRLELQADCYAGVWGYTARETNLLSAGDVEEGLAAAAGVGDDRIQRQAGRGQVNPESFTHGSSAQRQQWFTRGFQSGDMRSCDTFAGAI